MYRIILFILLACYQNELIAQQDLIYVKLTDWAKDDRFDKSELVLPLFITENDTIETNDFENLTESKQVSIIKPNGHRNYAYGYLYFRGIPNAFNPGYVNVLVCNYNSKEPLIYVDVNNNYNFTDDAPPRILPMVFNATDSVLIELGRADNPNAKLAFKLSRFNYGNKYTYKKLLAEHYQFYYPNRKLTGIDYCLREQRFVTRSGVVKYGNDSFRIAVFDANNNGLFNDTDTDKVITANMADSIFDSKDDLRCFTITNKKEDLYIEKDGEQFEILQIDPAGNYVVLKSLTEQLQMGRLPEGKKIPKFKYIDWQGNIHKIKKLRKYDVFIYFTGPNSKNFNKDTATLRLLAATYPDKLRVIGFIDVNKSYELKIFGMYANLNWIAAFKKKDINRMLKIRGVPASLWLGKKRRLRKYNLSPDEFLKAFEIENNKTR
jgi:hypothetical protein